MFEHPDALRQSLIASFYQNSSNFDLRRIKQIIKVFESILNLPATASVELLLTATPPSRKFTVVVLGQQTRISHKLLPAQSLTSPLPFIVHEQAPPLKASSSIQYNNYISLNGDKLEACVKLIEGPPDTATAITQNSYLATTLNEFLAAADLIIISVPNEDRSDFQDTRLFGMLTRFKHKNQVFLDWPQHPNSIDGDSLQQVVNDEIDNRVESESNKIKVICQVLTDHIETLKKTNQQKEILNKAHSYNQIYISIGFAVLAVIAAAMILRQLCVRYHLGYL